MTSANMVANYLISKSASEGTLLTNKRLQKLLYYVQAWHLAINNEPIFQDKIEAWIHGPVIRSIYEEYKIYSASPINKTSGNSSGDDLGVTSMEFVDRIVKAYSIYNTPALEYMTHAEDPWQLARKGLETNESSNNEITHESMRTYYATRLASAKQ